LGLFVEVDVLVNIREKEFEKRFEEFFNKVFPSGIVIDFTGTAAFFCFFFTMY